jgi:MFS family permease
VKDLREAFAGPAGRVLLGCLVAQMGLGCVYFFGITLKYVVSDFSWSRAEFAGSSVPLLLGYAIGSPLVGTLTDRLGGRRVMSGAAVLLAATSSGSPACTRSGTSTPCPWPWGSRWSASGTSPWPR